VGTGVPERTTPSAAAREFVRAPLPFLRDGLREARVRDRPYTRTFLGVVVSLFLATAVAAYLRTGTVGPGLVVAALFVAAPEAAWPAAALLHRGVGHLAANVAVLYVAAPVEDDLSLREYLAVLVVTGYLPLFADGLKLELLGNTAHVAAYGASAFGYGLLGVGLVTFGRRGRVTRREFLILLLGLLSVVGVAANVVRGVFDPLSLELGHLLGLVFGAGLACYSSSSRSATNSSGSNRRRSS
jgi:membrane associated rhomboid family serine protease